MTPFAAPAATRPKMVFFRLTRRDLPAFVDLHLADHLACLRQWFDVVLVTDDVDFDEICDREEPDLVLFESGIYARPDRRIRNAGTHRDVPRLGFLDADPYCLTRSVFLADMDEWGVETFFTIAVTAAAHTPGIADRLYSWPNFADRRVFHPYGDQKATSVLLAGSRRPNYPWRVMVDRALSERFPVRSLPHSGWFDQRAAAGMPTGEAWARTLSAAQIVPVCGTVADDLVRKHFEVPASGAVLVTERTPAVEAAGFVDGINCVFADPDDVADRVADLLQDDDLRASIAEAGRELAHERHDISRRDQVLQWYRLQAERRPGEQIVQPGPFAPLELRRADRGAGATFPPSRDMRELHAAAALLAEGELGAAAEGYALVLNQHLEPEGVLGLARARLRAGDRTQATELVEGLVERELEEHGAHRPDAVEWAFLLRCDLAAGDAASAECRARRFPTLGHPELRRMRHVLAALQGSPQLPSGGDGVHSVHALAATEWSDWLDALTADLEACGLAELAGRVLAIPAPTPETDGGTARAIDGPAGTAPALRPRPGGAARVAHAVGRRIRPPRHPSGPDDSLFAVFARDDISAIVSVLVRDADVAAALERLIANDPSDSALVRLGRDGAVPPSPSPAGALGRRSGVGAAVGAALAAFVPAVIVAGPDGAAYLRADEVAHAAALILVDPESRGHRRLRADLAASQRWRRGDEGLRRDVLHSLAPATGVDVWLPVPRGGGR